MHESFGCNDCGPYMTSIDTTMILRNETSLPLSRPDSYRSRGRQT